MRSFHDVGAASGSPRGAATSGPVSHAETRTYCSTRGREQPVGVGLAGSGPEVAARQRACAGMDLAEIARLPALPGAPDTGEPGCDLLAVLQAQQCFDLDRLALRIGDLPADPQELRWYLPRSHADPLSVPSPRYPGNRRYDQRSSSGSEPTDPRTRQMTHVVSFVSRTRYSAALWVAISPANPGAPPECGDEDSSLGAPAPA